MGGDTERLTFPNGRGETLAARLEHPVGTPLAFAIFAHCFTCSKDIIAAGRVSRALRDEGVAVLRFDFTGIGNSEGDFANTSFSTNVKDLVAAADHLRETQRAPTLLVGHSLGGAAVIVVAPEIPEVEAVATIGAPSDPAHLKSVLRDHLDTIEEEGEASVPIAGRDVRVTRDFIRDIEAQSLDAALERFEGALMIFHSPVDDVVGVDHARRLYEAARHPKSFVSLDGADHLLTKKADARYVGRMLAAWASRHVCKAPTEEAPSDEAPSGDVRVVESGPKYGQEVRMRRHVLRADEPAAAGGQDTGPTPYDLLLAALGTCTSMTLRMYADRKGWPLRDVSTRLRYSRIHADDCESCESDEQWAHRFEREVGLEGPLSDEQRERLLEIADRCPVHRSLEGPKEIVTRFAGGDDDETS